MVVIAFDAPEEADRVLSRLVELESHSSGDLEDAVIAVRNSAGHVRLKQSITSRSETRQGLISGALFGTLIGALFLNPLAGLAAGSVIGGATGALTGSLLDFEISDDFVREVGRSLRPNSSALFLLVRRMKPEVLKELQGSGGHVLRVDLPPTAGSARCRALLAPRRQWRWLAENWLGKQFPPTKSMSPYARRELDNARSSLKRCAASKPRD